MIIDLTPEEIEQIEHWYHACCHESATSKDTVMFAVLEKLGIEADPFDLYVARHDSDEVLASVIAYINRHPEVERYLNQDGDRVTAEALGAVQRTREALEKTEFSAHGGRLLHGIAVGPSGRVISTFALREPLKADMYVLASHWQNGVADANGELFTVPVGGHLDIAYNNNEALTQYRRGGRNG
jgi:hypothetical protein